MKLRRVPYRPDRVLMNLSPGIGICVLLAASVYGQGRGARGAPWRHHTIDVGLSGADGGKLLDADGDGDLDLAVGWEESGVSKIYLNPGIGGGVAETWADIGVGRASNVEDAVMGDIDGDGRVDVVSSTEGSRRRILVHFAPIVGDYTDSSLWTTSEFPLSMGVPHSKWMYAVISDVNEDGHVDIVAGGKDSGAHLGWFEAPATDRRNLASWSYHKMGDVGWTMSLIQADMDGDSDLDFIVSDRKPGSADLVGARWLENPGTGGQGSGLWTNHFIFAPSDPSTEIMFMGLADIDRDGDLDVVVPLIVPNRLRWYERLDSSGDSWSGHTINLPSGIGSRLKAAKMADLNGDSQLDLVLTISQSSPPLSGVLWFEHEGDPFVSDWVAREISGSIGEKFDDVVMVDLDGDGDLDIITTEENAPPGSIGLGVIWYENPNALEVRFLRGDCNDDGDVNVSDAVCNLNWLFGGPAPVGCAAALNTNGDAGVNITDAVSLLNFLFSDGSAPAAPYPDCGPGMLPADMAFGCANPPNCQ